MPGAHWWDKYIDYTTFYTVEFIEYQNFSYWIELWIMFIYISVLLHHSLQIALYKNPKIKYGKLSLKLPILFPIEKYQEILSLQARVWAISPRNPQWSICIGMGIRLNHTCIYIFTLVPLTPKLVFVPVKHQFLFIINRQC